ncbi:tRNA (adenosine(37)-N6)-dimethylallyltransferase MiaA [Alisedimentitalea sp. MJ-SS2]|uniref:tRNA (adenosine(37)-N6)-dimethylallyltransferase MiaA n=1 Tax=Aliisedimentitalea sp. MJ-SS2 TaxID=3049795 RepID=UPI0029099FF3|nr:tRNA (adenosine(37)-N6)-dimethylallyltransferase MiaA [Alisedimentitalea sp. MJ-SS2]MDU8929778.1 tRNA (adenosine(37)-N6)-dimethylallyltransferase MiaA [Alisedimentitalea sp. MJ-SS2]
MINLDDIPADRPVLIAGPTASGKSALALEIAETQGGTIINADALQVFANWQILTARPPHEDLIRAPHALYGHVPADVDYSVGHWLRDLDSYLSTTRPIIVGGTGLYFTALTEGLAQIPPTPPDIRAHADTLGREEMLAALDPETADRIDRLNRMRVQRAWEVQRATGRGLADWQDDTPPPRLPLSAITPLVIDAPKEWLTPRIERRFDLMLDAGALDEARANLAHWDPNHPSSRAIGAPELIAHLRGELSLNQARDAAIIATRQYAKRQRTWFRARMKEWNALQAA